MPAVLIPIVDDRPLLLPLSSKLLKVIVNESKNIHHTSSLRFDPSPASLVLSCLYVSTLGLFKSSAVNESALCSVERGDRLLAMLSMISVCRTPVATVVCGGSGLLPLTTGCGSEMTGLLRRPTLI